MAKVLLDVDGVLCDFISGYLGLVKLVTGRSYVYEDVTDWSFKKCLALTDKEEKAVHELLFKPGFVRGLSSLPGTYEGVSSIINAGHEIVFVTSPWKGHPTWAHERCEWLEERWSKCSIVSTHDKFHIYGDYLVDDKPEHLVLWSAYNGKPLLWDAPYNRAVDTACRVNDWPSALGVIGSDIAPVGDDRSGAA